MGQQDQGKGGQKDGGQKQQNASQNGPKGRPDGSRTGMRQGSDVEGSERDRGVSRGAPGEDDAEDGEDINEGSRPVPSRDGRDNSKSNR